jgi:CRAL/TRIO domain
MKLSQVTREFLTLVKGIAAIDKDQYPETLGKLFIINVPSVFPLVWRSVQFFLDPATTAKIEIFGPKKDWLPALASQIGLENMPVTYGGVLPALSADVHPYAESMKSFNENKSTPPLNGGEGVGGDEAGGDEYALGSEEHGGCPLDEVDMYINRGKAAAQQLRLQAQASANAASSPRSNGARMSPMKRILGALLPSTESRDSLKDTGVLDEDSFSSNLTRRPSSTAGSGTGSGTGTTNGTRAMRSVNNPEGNGSQDATAATVGDRWEEELQYARELDLASPSGASKQGSGAHTRTDGCEGEGEVETTPYVHKGRFYRLCCCDTWRRVPGFSRGASAVAALMRAITLHDFLNKRSLKQIRKYLFYAISLYMVAALTAMVVSAYLTSETLWLSTVALYVHLWTGVVVLLVSVVMIAVNLAAFIGCYYQNRAMLIMYAGMMWSGIVMFGIIAIASFLYDSYPAVSKLSSSLEGPFKDRNSGICLNRYPSAYMLTFHLSILCTIHLSVLLAFHLSMHLSISSRMFLLLSSIMTPLHSPCALSWRLVYSGIKDRTGV